MSKDVVRLADDSPNFGGNGVFDAFGYSPAVRAGGLLFVAGQVGIRPDGTIPEDAAEQIELVFRRTGEILGRAGLGFDALVEMVSYHVNVGEHLAAFREVKDRYVPSPFPAWTILGVASLARPVFKIELKCVAAF